MFDNTNEFQRGDTVRVLNATRVMGHKIEKDAVGVVKVPEPYGNPGVAYVMVNKVKVPIPKTNLAIVDEK